MRNRQIVLQNGCTLWIHSTNEKVYLGLFVCFFDFVELNIFIHSLLYLFSPLVSSPVTPTLTICSGYVVFFTCLCRSMYVFLSLGPLCCLASLRLWPIGWFFSVFCLKATYESIHIIFVLLCLG